MLELDIRHNSAQVIARLHNFRATHMPRAMKNAANATGRYVNAALRSEMTQVFDRPVPWTLGGLKFKLATDDKPLVRIWLDEWGDKGIPVARYLKAEIEGGQRRRKRFERALIEAGKMPPTAYAVPGRQAPIDAHGNVPGWFIVRVLSDLQSFGEQGYRANRRGKRKGWRKTNYFFIPRPGSGKPPGVYWHMPNGLLGIVFLFVSRTSYRKRYDFYGVAQRAYDRVAMRLLQQEIERPGSTRSPRSGRS